MANWKIINADCVEAMNAMEPGSIDSIVCDPPYELGFMGKSWDSTGVAYKVETWEAARRVLKPGGHLLAFGGSRTFHRLAVAIEDAGFEIRDTLSWLYGSGFPKSMNVSKAMDKAERGVPHGGVDPTSPNHGKYRTQGTEGKRGEGDRGQGFGAGPGQFMAESGDRSVRDLGETAREWEGWGTALKPAWEPIIMARKPFKGTVVKNVLEHGTGAINVDASRVGVSKDVPASISRHVARDEGVYEGNRDGSWGNEQGGAGSGHDPNTGRWPPNVALGHTEDCVTGGDHVGEDGLEEVEAWGCTPDCPVAMLDDQTGKLAAGIRPGKRGPDKERTSYGAFGGDGRDEQWIKLDGGGASRFFYVAKAAKRERNVGLEGLPTGTDYRTTGGGLRTARRCPEHDKSLPSGANTYECGCKIVYTGETKERQETANTHPTVKPIALMRWLVKMVTPPGGTVLDPFTGSGTTGCAVVLDGFDFVGVELEADYIALAEARITYWEKCPPLAPGGRPHKLGL